MSYNIAVEGLEDDIVPHVWRMLNRNGYNMVYRNESPISSNDRSGVIDSIIKSRPDLTVLCNVRGYEDFLRKYKENTSIPLIVLTGGGPVFEEVARKYTPNVLSVPFPIELLYNEIEKILKQQVSDS